MYTPEKTNVQLNEQEEEKRARLIREREQGKFDFERLDNKQKLEVIKNWYPRAYRCIRDFYPCFLIWPNDFPPAYSKAINAMIVNIVWQHRVELAFV